VQVDRVTEYYINVPTERFVRIELDAHMVGKIPAENEMSILVRTANSIYHNATTIPAEVGHEVEMPDIDVLKKVFEKLVIRMNENKHSHPHDVNIMGVCHGIENVPDRWEEYVLGHLVDFYDYMNTYLGFPRDQEGFTDYENQDCRVRVFEYFMHAIKNSVVSRYY